MITRLPRYLGCASVIALAGTGAHVASDEARTRSATCLAKFAPVYGRYQFENLANSANGPSQRATSMAR
jgi:hypothetical protein